MLHHPARDKIIVVCIERAEEAEAGVFVEEARHKGFVLQDGGAVGRGAAGDDEDAAVDGVGGCDFKVVTLKVEAADDVPKGREGEA